MISRGHPRRAAGRPWRMFPRAPPPLSTVTNPRFGMLRANQQGCLMKCLQQYRRQLLQRIMSRIHIEAGGFQYGYDEKRLYVRVPEHDRRSGGFPHQIHFGYGELQSDRASVRRNVTRVRRAASARCFPAPPWARDSRTPAYPPETCHPKTESRIDACRAARKSQKPTFRQSGEWQGGQGAMYNRDGEIA